MSNPYQPWFDKLDQTVAALEDDPAGAGPEVKDAAVLLRQAGFVLANLLNVNAQVLPTLILPVEAESVAEVEDETPSDSATSST